MERRRFVRSVAAVGAAVSAAGCLAADPLRSRSDSIGDRDPSPYADGSDAWPAAGFDAANAGHNPAVPLLEGDLEATTVASGDVASGGVAAVGDCCYFVTSDGTAVCEARGDDRRWTADLGGADFGSVPAATRDVVYASGADGTTALDRRDGATLWTSDAGVRRGSVLLLDGRLYAAADGRVVALEVDTGDRAWAVDAHRVTGLAAADGTVFATGTASDGGAVSAVADGRRRWLRDDLGSVHVPPTVADDLVLVSTSLGRLYALDRATGETVWRRERPGGGPAPPTAAHGRVYLPSGNGSRTTCLDRASGDALWRLETGVFHAQPVATADGVYFGTPTEGLFAVEPDGAVRWRDETIRVDGSMAAVGDALFAASVDGVVAITSA